MTLDDVLQWLKSLGAPAGVEGWTIARLDASKQRRIGVRQLSGAFEPAIGGEACTLTRTKRVQALVHWTRNAHDTELAAQALFDAIRAADHPAIGGAVATYIHPRAAEPVDLGPDEGGTFERAIELDIYYQQQTD